MTPFSSPPTTKRPIEVAIAVIAKNVAGKVEILAAWREESLLRGGVWELPGGKVDATETIPQAAAREAMEELGVEIQTGALIGTSEDHNELLEREQHVRVHAVHATLSGSEPAPTVERLWQWIPVSQLQEYPWPRANAHLNRLIMQALS